ncbi:MAG: ADP-ribosylglycohydrolase family protein [Synergistaceae bacterium]|nr:ADP-ribosylglycohydrolase family protein [Synergistaceae bacterium]
MLGAIVGDVVGSPFEFDRHRREAHSRDYPLVSDWSYATDDSILTLAVAEGVMDSMPRRGDKTTPEIFAEKVSASMRKYGRRYPDAGYGIRFMDWLAHDDPQPYNSCGNGSAMRVSPVGWAFDTLEETERFAEASSAVSHNHPEGIKGAQATAGCIFLARTGAAKQDIRHYVAERYGYDLSRSIAEIQQTYYHVETCQQTVPEAITAFLEGENFEDVTRGAVSLCGDADTLTAIACSIAEAFYGIPDGISAMVLPKLERCGHDLVEVLERWEKWRA